MNQSGNEGQWEELPAEIGERSGKIEKACDIANLLVGAGLFLSPWILGFGAGPPNAATQSAGVSGAFIGVLSFAALYYVFEIWEAWLILLVATCALVSPWIFGFAGTTAMLVLLCGGTLSILLAATRLRLWSRLLLRASEQPIVIRTSRPDAALPRKVSHDPSRAFTDRRASDARLHTSRSRRASEARASPVP